MTAPMPSGAASDLRVARRLLPPEALELAFHASLPVAVDPRLLHLTRVNFLPDLPFDLEARLLLSPLFHDLGDGLYEIKPQLRNLLLAGLVARYGRRRLREVAILLEKYTDQHTSWPDNPELRHAQHLTALHVLRPELAEQWLDDNERAAGHGSPLGRTWFVAMRGQIESVDLPEPALLHRRLWTAVQRLRLAGAGRSVADVRAVTELAFLSGAGPDAGIAAEVLLEIAREPAGSAAPVCREAERALRELRDDAHGGPIPPGTPAPAAAPSPDAGAGLAGRLLVTAPAARGGVGPAVLLVLRHEPARGALGVRIDAPMDTPLTGVPAGWLPLLAPPATVFEGGTAARRKGLIALGVLRENAPPPAGFRPLRGRLGTVSLSADPAPLAPALVGMRLFWGYLGWAPGELESEVESGLLVPVPGSAELAAGPAELAAGPAELAAGSAEPTTHTGSPTSTGPTTPGGSTPSGEPDTPARPTAPGGSTTATGPTASGGAATRAGPTGPDRPAGPDGSTPSADDGTGDAVAAGGSADAVARWLLSDVPDGLWSALSAASSGGAG